LTAKIVKDIAKFSEKIFPRVLVATPAPPALRKVRIGKETAAGMVPPVCFLSFNRSWLLALSFRLKSS
jgi:hypothetical protein